MSSKITLTETQPAQDSTFIAYCDCDNQSQNILKLLPIGPHPRPQKSTIDREEGKWARQSPLLKLLTLLGCVPFNFMANRRVPKFFFNNCAQSTGKTFMCPTFRTNAIFKYTKCYISTNLSSFLKLCLLYCQKYLPLLQQIADSLKKIGLVGTLLLGPDKKNSCTAERLYTNDALSLILFPPITACFFR